MPIDNGAIVLVSFRGLCFGQRIILTHTLRKTSAPAGTKTVEQELESIIEDTKAGGNIALVPPYLACLPTTYSLTEIRAQVISPVRSAYLTNSELLVGTHASPATVANDSAAITLRTALAGRREVSTKKIGPVPDAASAAGLLTTPYRGLLSQVALALKQTTVLPDGEAYSPVIWHRNLVPSFSLVTNHVLGDQSRTQRRRTVGLGE